MRHFACFLYHFCTNSLPGAPWNCLTHFHLTLSRTGRNAQKLVGWVGSFVLANLTLSRGRALIFGYKVQKNCISESSELKCAEFHEFFTSLFLLLFVADEQGLADSPSCKEW